jgi:hypothetical protein
MANRLNQRQHLKRRKLGEVFELDRSATPLIMDVVKHLEAAADRQTEVLSKIYGVLESRAKQTVVYVLVCNTFVVRLYSSSVIVNLMKSEKSRTSGVRLK